MAVANDFAACGFDLLKCEHGRRITIRMSIDASASNGGGESHVCRIKELGIFDGLGGEALSNPTSMPLGPDGRFGMSKQNGLTNAHGLENEGGAWVTTTGELLEDDNGAEIATRAAPGRPQFLQLLQRSPDEAQSSPITRQSPASPLTTFISRGPCSAGAN